ncbi:MAG: NAD(P)H-binding protein [Polyangiaceae bacterium]|nr:NAD(P)H-binding protein [Polyangiaceae bacterium]
MTTAILLGATGLVGSELLSLLCEDASYSRVVSIARRASGKSHDKLDERVIDLADEAAIAQAAEGDVLFSCLGTTKKKAGSEAAQYEVDVAIPLRVAKAARKNGTSTYAVVSAVGADARSSLFYNRIKGELDDAVQALGFERVRILRPSILVGERAEHRPMEALGATLSKGLAFIPGLRKYRPIPARVVAMGLLAATMDPTPGTRIHEADALFSLGGSA